MPCSVSRLPTSSHDNGRREYEAAKAKCRESVGGLRRFQSQLQSQSQSQSSISMGIMIWPDGRVNGQLDVVRLLTGSLVEWGCVG